MHRSEIQELEKKLGEATENFNVELTKREISDIERSRVQKNVEELRQAKEKCYNVATKCAKNLKNSFSKVGAFSLEKSFVGGDPDGVLRWINSEVEAFEEILSDRGDFCAFAVPVGPYQSYKRSATNMPRGIQFTINPSIGIFKGQFSN